MHFVKHCAVVKYLWDHKIHIKKIPTKRLNKIRRKENVQIVQISLRLT